MPAFPLLWPVIALVLLTFVVWFAVVLKRFGHMRATPPTAEDFATRDSASRYFAPVELPANNLANLFEMPVLFFVGIVLLIQTELANDIYVVLAWAYVLLRAVHSWFHLRGRVRQRFFAYALSNAVLLAIWTGFAIDAARAAHAYAETYAELNAMVGE